MSGIETTLKAQLGVKLNISMDSTIVWFVWDKDEPLEAWRVNNAVMDGGMGITELFILGDFTFKDGKATTSKGVVLDYEGAPIKDGKWAIEITRYDSEEMQPKVYEVKEYFTPKTFKPAE